MSKAPNSVPVSCERPRFLMSEGERHGRSFVQTADTGATAFSIAHRLVLDYRSVNAVHSRPRGWADLHRAPGRGNHQPKLKRLSQKLCCGPPRLVDDSSSESSEGSEVNGNASLAWDVGHTIEYLIRSGRGEEVSLHYIRSGMNNAADDLSRSSTD